MGSEPVALCVAAVAPGVRESLQASMPAARVLVVERTDGGVYLLAFDEAGAPAGDTWHESSAAAQEQAAYSFGDRVTDWLDAPSDTRQAERFALREAAGLLRARAERLAAARKPVDVRSDLPAELYRSVLRAAVERDVCALLVVRDPRELGASARALLSELSPFLIRQETTSEWPGTRLLADEAHVSYYDLSDECADLLASAADGLFDWVHPARPEDLSLLRADGTPWLVNIAHEHDAYFELEADERATLLEELPGLAPHLA